MRAIQDLFYGFLLPLIALKRILSRPRLFLLSLIPLTIAIVIAFLGLSALKDLLMAYGMKLLTQWGWATSGVSVQVANFLFSLAVIVLGAMTFSVVAAIVAAPFNDFLAEAAEPDAGLETLPAQYQTWRFRARTVGIDIVKTLAVGILQLLNLLVGLITIWIPGLNVLFAAIAFTLLAYQFIAYPQTRRGIGFVESLGFLQRNLLAVLGFGASIGFLFAIPVVSAFILPLAVVGGTLLYGRAEKTPEVAPTFW